MLMVLTSMTLKTLFCACSDDVFQPRNPTTRNRIRFDIDAKIGPLRTGWMTYTPWPGHVSIESLIL
jgi:hypothetical protein